MRRQDLQPFSRQAWEEKRRRWAIEQEQTKRRRARVLILVVSLVAVLAGAWFYIVSPGDWRGKAGRYTRDVIKTGLE